MKQRKSCENLLYIYHLYPKTKWFRMALRKNAILAKQPCQKASIFPTNGTTFDGTSLSQNSNFIFSFWELSHFGELRNNPVWEDGSLNLRKRKTLFETIAKHSIRLHSSLLPIYFLWPYLD